ncbi:unnamed protein product [Paramecium sonneborni]|uniref:Saccharopine dehydrogenase n=1 Tax=Paramecium sonneborni TaxID=65129 RepID=A0A8S1NTT4_9CILI|nr:unnamed protein product [Paramecium sonneborni]
MLSLYRNQLKGVQKKVLLIGSGLMAEAVIDQLLKRNDNFVVVASAHVEDARKVIQNKQRCSAHHLDVTETEELRKFVQNSDIVIAYIPPQFIVGIAKICAEVGRSMITSQYTFPEIRALEQECKKKGIIILNEIGLDPGIDHLATVKVKDEVYAKGGKIIEYESWCGGVPSPEFCDNPFGYKFSWSPFAAIRNINNDAKYLENGVQKYIPASELLYSTEIIHVNPSLQMEGYPNRDSLPYQELYGLKDCQKLVRGTLRYQGHCVLMAAMKALGFASEDLIKVDREMSWFEYLLSNVRFESCSSKYLGNHHITQLANTIDQKVFTLAQLETLLTKVFNRVFSQYYYKDKSEEQQYKDAEQIVQTLKWMGVFDPKNLILNNVAHVHNFAAHLQTLMNYKQGETDLVAMQHIFKIVYPNDPRVYVKKSTMVKIGHRNGKSAMAITVGVPTAVATQLILDGVIKVTGVHMPNISEINTPLYEELKKEGIYCEEEDY